MSMYSADEGARLAPSGEAGIDRFMAAISGTESGGNYQARNASGAYGRFQIMPANWPSWSREALGTPPPGGWPQTAANQDKVARFKMLQYYRQYGSWEAVAVAWFAGPSRAQRYVNGDRSVLEISDGNITVGEYVRRVQNGMGTAGTGGTGGGGTGGGAGGGPGYESQLSPNASPAEIEEYIKTNYPQAAGYLNVPEVRAILIDAAKAEMAGDPWSDDKVMAKIQATNWWRWNPASVRNFIYLQETDPATAERMIEQKITEIRPEFEQLGLHVDIRAIAEAALRNGWSDAQLRENFEGHLAYASRTSGLDEGSIVDISADELMNMARNEYFIPLSRGDVERWAIDIYAGKRTEDQFRSYLLTQAEGRFPGIDKTGVSPGEYLAPVRNIIAETLEINPADVDLLSPRFSAVLQAPVEGTPRPMTIYEAQRWARSQNEYKYTKGANDEVDGFIDTLGRRFGLIA